MGKFKVGFIGTGKKQRPSNMGYAMAYQHATAYAKLDNCEMVACADIAPENVEEFAKTNNIPHIYLNHHEMLEKEDLDIVSVCVWPHLHKEMVIACALAGIRAVHCEKPMAYTWGDSRLMAQECERRRVQLTFNHQRRFGKPFRTARELLKAGEIGELVRLEGACGDIYDGGTHFVDMFGFYNDEAPAAWIIAQIDCRSEQRAFGALLETQGIFYWQYQNGVYALMATGSGSEGIGVLNRLIGTEGVIEVGAPDNVVLRIKRCGSASWENINCGNENLHGPGYIDRAIADLVDALETGREPELSARKALNATEIIFAGYESSRRRARVDLPLTISDNPLVVLFERGELHAKPKTAD
ncbi:Gfo/Idh/MocA family oxidoreductase [Candidatus Poribacteria bacterium]|nr:Gfo/Idh/MocA family oxidoreductase [Candidatus Poribacteria bacterium]